MSYFRQGLSDTEMPDDATQQAMLASCRAQNTVNGVVNDAAVTVCLKKAIDANDPSVVDQVSNSISSAFSSISTALFGGGSTSSSDHPVPLTAAEQQKLLAGLNAGAPLPSGVTRLPNGTFVKPAGSKLPLVLGIAAVGIVGVLLLRPRTNPARRRRRRR